MSQHQPNMNHPKTDAPAQTASKLLDQGGLYTYAPAEFKPISGTELSVCQDIAERQQHGIAKYGTTVEQNPLGLKAWLQHAYEECLDQAIYLKRAMDCLNEALRKITYQQPTQDQFEEERLKTASGLD